MSDSNFSTYFYVQNNPLISNGANEEQILAEVSKNKIEAVVLHFSASSYDNVDFVNRLVKFLDLMEAIEVNVFLIAPIPASEFHIPELMIRMVREPSYETSPIKLSDYHASSNQFFEFIKSEKIEDKFILYPHLVMCPGDFCLYEKKGVPFYFDEHHLTLTGARQLAPLFIDLANRMRR